MANQAQNQLTLACAGLVRAAPAEWDRFMGAFTVFSQEQFVNLMQSTLEELPRSQGRAQMASQLHGIMAECISSAAKLEHK